MDRASEDLTAVPARRGYGGHAGALQDDIKQLLIDLHLQPGDGIPSEASLIERLGVSRGSLREALKGLQALGVLETRHGSGTYVSAMSFEKLADGMVFHAKLGGADDLSMIAELADIREILETALIQRVASVATDDLLDQLDSVVAQMRQRVEAGEDADDLDRRFHSLLYGELRRPLINQLLEAFWRALSAARPVLPRAFMSGHDAVQKHADIVSALRAGDAAAAAAAMHDHFAGTRVWVGLNAN